MRTLKEISNDTFYKMGEYHQITIDLVEETQRLFNEDTPETRDENQELLTNLGALSYDISICLEVFNPEFKKEISDLKHIESLIEIRMGYVQSLNIKTIKK